MKRLILHRHENITYKFINKIIEIKATETLLHAHEYCLTIISHTSFSEREGDWDWHGMFMPGMVKKDRERERERESDPGGYLLPSTGISYGSKYALGIFYRSKYPPLSICYHK